MRSTAPFRVLGSLATIVTLLASREARADEAVCRDVYEQSQELMKPKAGASTLLPAREMLRTCMRSGCKDWVVADCSKWLSEVEGRIPTVVFSAKDTAGRDLTDVQVTRPDGTPIVARLDGRALEMEPGEQSFVFVAADGARRDKQVLVREGEKSQSVTSLFDAPPGTLPVSTAGTEHTPATAPVSKMRYAGYGAAAAGIVGLGVGAVFGLRAIDKKDSARCDAAGACDDAVALEDSKSAATTATVAFTVGAALAAAGVVLVLLAPSPGKPRTAQLRPMLGSAGGGLELGARW